jgi:hypothetical protein
MAGIDMQVKRIGELLESREDVAQEEREQGRQQGPGQARTPHSSRHGAPSGVRPCAQTRCERRLAQAVAARAVR